MSFTQLYKPSMALLTDLYQLTMAYGYWKSGSAEKETVFNLFFRKHPFHGGFTLFAGLEDAAAFMEQFSFDSTDLEYLAGLTGSDDRPLFEPGFLEYLRKLEFTCDVHAMREGEFVFPQQPLIRLRGPILQCQLLETALLNIINFQSLIATKAARVTAAAKGDPVLEFGLRRAQGIDGSLSASRAAFVGGCAGTSNVLAGRLYGIPVKGTHAHSWIMSFEDELEAFEAYADAMPNNCVFLVDTYDTLAGVKKAVEVGRRLRTRGFDMLGIRLDSGDLTALSIQARRILDDAGFTSAAIVASNDLDEYEIAKLKAAGAKISMWGVGTRLVTAYDQPALGGVYKLAAVREGQHWIPKIKLSDSPAKISNPGILQVRRHLDGSGQPLADEIYDENQTNGSGQRDAAGQAVAIHGARAEDLLSPLFLGGQRVQPAPTLTEVRAFADGRKALFEPVLADHAYEVLLADDLFRLKSELITRAHARA